jgi:hypothetical protein
LTRGKICNRTDETVFLTVDDPSRQKHNQTPD